MSEVIINAENHIVGRLASYLAKELLKGETILVVNVEKAVLSGNPKAVVKEYKKKIARGDPYHGPFYPKNPDLILKRIVRGMLPYKKKHGKEALKRLKVFISVPDQLKGKEFVQIEQAKNKLECKFITLEELVKRL